MFITPDRAESPNSMFNRFKSDGTERAGSPNSTHSSGSKGSKSKASGRRWSLVSNGTNETSLSHQNSWHVPGESLILLDWDDTLCPTACLHEADTNREEIEEQVLLEHQIAVTDFLRAASELGHVVIVTMASMSWVNKSLARMSRVDNVLKDLKIEIISARESMPQRILRSAFSDDRDPAQYLKTQAMENVIKRFYKSSGTMRRIVGGAKSRSWKNIISIGDSRAERLALQDLVFRRQQRSRTGAWKECRCKTLLLIATPNFEQMLKELQTMTASLSALVHHDGDIHLNLEISGDLEDGDVQLSLDAGDDDDMPTAFQDLGPKA